MDAQESMARAELRSAADRLLGTPPFTSKSAFASLAAEVFADEMERQPHRVPLRTTTDWTWEQIVEALQRWAAAHGGLAPSRREWAKAADEYPSALTVTSRAAAVRPKRRWRYSRDPRSPCADYPSCGCGRGTHWIHETTGEAFCSGAGCLTCTGQCPDVDHVYEDPSDWAWALQQAGLDVRRGSDSQATRSRAHEHARNRQMVTGRGNTGPGAIRHSHEHRP